jgi:hypothetical protein
MYRRDIVWFPSLLTRVYHIESTSAVHALCNPAVVFALWLYLLRTIVLLLTGSSMLRLAIRFRKDMIVTFC